MNIKKGGIILGFALGILGIGTYIFKQFQLLSDACYSITGAIIHKISLTNIKFTMMMAFYNSSDIDFSIKKQDYNIFVNDVHVAHVFNDSPVKVLANSKSIIKIDIDFNPQDLLKAGLSNLESLIFDKSKLIIATRGFVKIVSGIVVINKYEINEKMSLGEMLQGGNNEKCEIQENN